VGQGVVAEDRGLSEPLQPEDLGTDRVMIGKMKVTRTTDEGLDKVLKAINFTGNPESDITLIVRQCGNILSCVTLTRQTPQTQKSAMLSCPCWLTLLQFADYKT
jgi:hypothetical protein